MKVKFELSAIQDDHGNSRRSTMGFRVFEILKQAIVQVQLRPGNLLSEAEVAKQLGLSRQPVREAFIKLADVGLVEIRPQRGTFVVFISEEEVRNARFIREAIEVAIVKKAAMEATDEDIANLNDLLLKQLEDEKTGDMSAFLAHDEEFHLAIASTGGCQKAWSIIENLKAQMDRVRYLSMGNQTPIKTLIAQHELIVKAIAERAPERAEAAMRLHLSEILNSLPGIREANAELFVD
ncbi:MAG: GntR family transcriptional regulator [Alphaproteobacteria bacterium]|nr:GntR family transcriptional regulator [Alphaproteobacteria bacterium]